MTAIVVGAAAWWITEPPERALATNPTPLTANPIEASVTGMAISADGTYLAYTANDELFLRTLASGEIHRVELPDGYRTWRVHWYPDGTRLLLTALSEGKDVPGLYSMSILGGTPTLLTDGATKAAVAPDGSAIAFLATDTSAERALREIWLMGPNGETPQPFLTAGQGESYWQLGFSPDSQRLAYGSWHRDPDGDTLLIETRRLDGSGTTGLISDGRLFQNWTGVLPFVWNDDGQLIYGRRELNPNQLTSNLWGIQTDIQRGEAVSEPVRLTQLSDFNIREVSVSRDTNQLTFLLVRNQADVYVADIGEDGTQIEVARQITTDEREDLPSGWTVDGTAILFDSLRAGTWDVYKRVLDEPTAEPLFSGLGSQSGAISTFDGSSVLYETGLQSVETDSLRDEGPAVMRGPVEGGPSQVITEDSSIGFQCSNEQTALCVIGERVDDTLVFSVLDALTGRGPELARIPDFPPFIGWDLTRDGARVAVVHNDDNRIRIVNLQTGDEDAIALDDWRGFEFVSWAADDGSLYVSGSSTSNPGYPALLHVELNGRVAVVRQARNEWHVRPKVSPDGQSLAFAVMPFHGNVWSIQP